MLVREGASLAHDAIAARELSAVILAGGRSRRMGSPKAWLPLAGEPLLAWVAARVQPLVGEVVVVGAAGQTLPPLTGRVLRDREPDLGPLPALAHALASIGTPYAFALACDAPFVRRGVLRLLAASIGEHAAAIPSWDGRLQPLVALYHARLAAPLARLAAAGERRLQAIADLPDVLVLSPEPLRAVDPAGLSFRTLNTPDEYAAARREWASLPADD